MVGGKKNMPKILNQLLGLALAALLVAPLPWAAGTARAGESVLRLARGLAADNITVLIGRAIVVESTQPFTEVSVADPKIADVSPLSDRTVYIFGKARGATSLTFLGEKGALITNVTVRVVPDLAELKQRLRTMLPGEPIDVRLTGSGVALSGVVSGKAKVHRAMELARAYLGEKSVINMMQVGGTQQVMLKVRVAEMSRSASKALGLDAFIAGTGNDIGGGLFTGPGAKPAIGIGQNTTPSFPGTSSNQAYGRLGFVAKLGDIGIGIALTALEQKGFARSLAEPNLVALSGNTATFLAGQEVPIPQVNSDGNVDVEFKQIGVALNFTPTVIDDDLVNLKVSTEVSAIDTTTEGVPISSFANAATVPVFTVRRATTTLELRDGESFAIAGLLRDQFSDALSQFPWLGDLPVLGTLFRSPQFQRGESELAIIISVHLVTPVNGDQLSLPIDHVRIPNEFELFLLGNTESAGAPGMVESQGFDGDFGYVVE